MMGSSPWDRNEGKFDVPSSSVPLPARHPAVAKLLKRAEAAPARARGERVSVAPPRAKSIDQQLVTAAARGVIAVGADTIVTRIEDAMRRLVEDGHGSTKAIYLTESDMMAFREAVGGEELKSVPVRLGTKSAAYSIRGVGRAVLRPKKPSKRTLPPPGPLL
jgi:hypothetical protein